MRDGVTRAPEAAHRRHAVHVDKDVGALRRAVVELAAAVRGLRAGEAALVATELGTNLVRHTTSGGYVLFRRLADGIELLAVDRGPGMADGAGQAPAGQAPAGQAPSGPRAGSGGLGVGLGSVERLATTFDIYSTRPGGTVVLARLLASAPPAGWCRWGAVNLPVEGGDESGDGWAVAVDGSATLLVVDGLGHGPAAAEAARTALAVFERVGAADVERFVERAHEAMRSTRGGVLSVCTVDPERGELRFAGVGNVTGRLMHGSTSVGLAGRDGTLGTELAVPRIHLSTHPWRPGSAVVLASDGLRSQWDLRGYPGLLLSHPAVVAATLQRDFARPTDDASVLVLQDLRRGIR